MWLGTVTRARHHLSMTYGVDDHRFETAYWYESTDLDVLETTYGSEFMRWIYFHILAFEATKVVSLAPESLDLGEWKDLHTIAFEELWSRVVNRIWAQWRYENDEPDYRGPGFLSEPVGTRPEPIRVSSGEPRVLAFCGGGKDSLVALRLLEGAGIPFDSYAYSHSVYGSSAHQHALIDRLLDHTAADSRQRQWIHDSFADSPVMRLGPGGERESMTLAETPASLFGVMPVVLGHGYTRLALAHERSANVGNLVWERTGEEINHQWGKSLEAERLLGRYVRQELVENARYFSLLQPLSDVGIFTLLRQEDPAAVAATHSCNVDKPWCRRCAKCAYVWLGYRAYLPEDRVDGPFLEENLLDVDETLPYFRQMLGLEEHTPFECIGQIAETRLAFELCRRRQLAGKAMEVFEREVAPVDAVAIAERHLRVELDDTQIPDDLLDALGPKLARVGELGRELPGLG